MDVKVTWKGRLSFTGTADSGFELPLGANPDVGGDDDGFRPMELMAISLAGCTAMDVISILQKKRQEVTRFEVRVHAERAQEHPHVFTAAILEYHVGGHKVDEVAVVRAIELSVTRYCSANAMLSQVMPIRYRYFLYEEGGEGESSLVTSGEYLTVRESG
jgi:putative redox protein